MQGRAEIYIFLSIHVSMGRETKLDLDHVQIQLPRGALLASHVLSVARDPKLSIQLFEQPPMI